MKKLLGLVLVLAALILGSYYVTGYITEHTFKKNIALISPSNGLAVSVGQYHRGWFHSNALLDMNLHIPARTVTNQDGQTTTVNEQDFKVQVPVDIYHGPVMIVDSKPLFGLGYAHSHVILPDSYAEKLTQNYTAESISPVLNMTLFVNYLNKSSLGLEMPAFKLISKQGNTTFEWLGMTNQSSISSDRTYVNGRVMIDGVNLSKDKMNLVLGKITSNYNLHVTNMDLYLGDADFLISSLVVKEATEVTLDARELNVHSTNDVVDGLFNSHLSVKLDKMLNDGQSYGPVSLDMSLKNIDAVVLAKINEQANGMQQGTDAERHQVLMSLLPQLPKLLSKGTTFEVSDLNIGMEDGVVKGNMLVSLPANDLDNPFQLIQKIKGHGKLQISAAVLKRLIADSTKQALQAQAPAEQTSPVDATAAVEPPKDIDQLAIVKADEKIAALVKSGLLINHDSDYLIELELADGQLLVNGKPFNQAMLQY